MNDDEDARTKKIYQNVDLIKQAKKNQMKYDPL